MSAIDSTILDKLVGLGEDLGLALLAIDSTGTVQGATTAAAQLCRMSVSDLMGCPLASGTLAANGSLAPAVLAQALDGGSWRGLAVVDSEHGARYLKVRSTPLSGDYGELLGALLTLDHPSSRSGGIHRSGLRDPGARLLREVDARRSLEWDPAADRLAVPDEVRKLLGVGADTPIRLNEALAAVVPEHRVRLMRQLERAAAGELASFVCQVKMHSADKGTFWIEIAAEVFTDDEGSERIRGTYHDITENVRADQRLRRTEEFWRATIDSLSDHVAVLDERGEIIAVNAAWRSFGERGGAGGDFVGSNYLAACEHNHEPAGALVAAGLRSVLRGEKDRFQFEYACDQPGGERRWFVMRATPHASSGDLRVVVSHEDVTETRLARQELEVARDHLRAVTDSMGEGMMTVDPTGAITYLNTVGRQLLGWSLGDIAGRDVAEVVGNAHNRQRPAAQWPIHRACRDRETIKVDDDTFLCWDGREIPVTYTAAPIATTTGVEGCVVVFSDITARKAKERETAKNLEALRWVKRLRGALDHNRFALYAQPIVEIATGAVVQQELLLRLDHPGDEEVGAGTITPGAFLPTAEEYGLVNEIDRWVIDRGVELAARGVSVELNISGRSIEDRSLVDHIAQEIARTGADPGRIVFEITETALINDEVAGREFVQALHALGCPVALDDFGTGYGGFTYLKQLPIDTLKIDVEFVRDLSGNAASRNVVAAIVKLADDFGLRTVAEGVEDEQTLDLLKALGVHYAQGYHIGRPRRLDSFTGDEP